VKLRDDWSAWVCLGAGYGLSLVGAVSAMAMRREPNPSGAAVFQQVCAACHGEANGSPVVRLPQPFEYDDELVRATVRDGRGEMPAFSTGQISDAEIDAVADFLRSNAPR
jgi:mono/diheme cytochrome c family protein